ncbi:MAG: hypothetical protein EA378_02395 [Phycisphaerales bacterium]|nr:MAG: hypothetical protein EA378_02395 [Phycisphaerales bacterium]
MKQQSLSRRTTQGAAMFVGSTLALKVLNTGGQLLLAALLAPEVFGLYSTALAVSEIASVIKRIGIREVLVRRRRAVARWASAAVWLSLLLGVLGGLSILLLGPLMIRPDLREELRFAVYLLALVAPLQALGVIPVALLQRQMRFGPIVCLQLAMAGVQTIGSVGLALGGFGVMALVLPRVAAELTHFIGGWFLARPTVRLRLDRPLWWHYFRSGTLLFPAAMATTLTMFGDYYILSFFVPPELVGAYFIAFMLSTQIGQLLIDNLSKVLLPSLSALQHDVRRQAGALLRSTRLLAVFTVPAYLMQAVVADPVLRLLYGDRWVDSIPILQLLSLAGIFAVLGSPSTSLLLAAGRYRMHLAIAAVRTALLLGLVALGAWQMGAVGAAIGVLLTRVIINPVSFVIAGRPGGVQWFDAVRVVRTPLIVAAIGCGVAIGGASLVPPEVAGHTRAGEALRVIISATLLGVVYAGGMWWFARPISQEVVGRLRDALPKGQGMNNERL